MGELHLEFLNKSSHGADLPVESSSRRALKKKNGYRLEPHLLLVIPVADFALLLRERQPLQGKERPNHRLTDRSASSLVFARTRLWTLKPVCCQERRSS